MEEDWFLYSITLFTFTVIFTFCYIRHVYTFFERNRITPAATPTFPFGNLYDVFFEKVPFFMQLWKFYNRFKRKKCKFGGFYMFLKPAVLLVDTKLIEMFVTKTDLFENEENPELNEEFCEEMLASVVKTVRKVWPKMGEINENEANFSQLMSGKFVELYIQEVFDSGGLGKRGTFSVFRDCLSLSYPQIFGKLHKNRGNVIERNEKSDILLVLSKYGFSHNDKIDFLANLVDYFKKSNNLILFTLYELSLNREIQDDLRGEITRFRKNKASFTYNELKEMTYLETVICETLRKYPIKPFIYKICKNNFIEDGLKFEKDQLVFISIFGVHHNVENYINPELFDPDRFSEENEMFIDSIKYLPFGHQTRNDFELLYVKLIMKLTLIELLTNYEFSIGKKSPKCITFDEAYFEIKSKEDMWLKIKKICS